MDVLKLSKILEGMPGISLVEGTNLYENCFVMLYKTKRMLGDKDDMFYMPKARLEISVVEYSTPKALFGKK